MTRSRIRTETDQYNLTISLVLRDGKYILVIPTIKHTRAPSVFRDYYEYMGYMTELIYNLQKGEQMAYGHWIFKYRTEE
jgi:hypothetical protein